MVGSPASRTALSGVLDAIRSGRAVDAAALQAAVADADDAAALVRLLEQHERLVQRDVQLGAVMASTRDLLDIRDVDSMLQRIVDRAFDLMGVDVAYLSVYDADDDMLVVRATRGISSPRFLGMIVPTGVGIASLVVRTRSPQWVEEYADATLPHDPEIDATLQEERLHSLLGVPLVAHDRTLGVLFAANRSPHRFQADEIALLSTFGGHAAIVLQVASLFEDVERSSQLAEDRRMRAEWAADLHAQLTAIVVDGGDPPRLMAAMAASLGREVALADADLRLVAGSARLLRAVPDLASVLETTVQSGRSVALGDGSEDDGAVELVTPVLVSRTRPGAVLVARGDAPLDDLARRTVERAALTLAFVTVQGDAIADAEERVRGELAVDVLDARSNAAGLRRAAARGLDVDAPWSAVAVTGDGEARARMLAAVGRHAGWLAAPTPEGFVTLVPEADAGTAARAVVGATAGAGAATDAAEPALAVGVTATTLAAAPDAARQASRAALLARGLGASGAVDAATLAPYASLVGGDGADAVATIEATLGPVLAWDRSRGTELVPTMLAVLDARGSATVAARALRVHPNTVKQRLARIAELLGERWEAPESRFRIEVAVRLETARRALASGA